MKVRIDPDFSRTSEFWGLAARREQEPYTVLLIADLSLPVDGALVLRDIELSDAVTETVLFRQAEASAELVNVSSRKAKEEATAFAWFSEKMPVTLPYVDVRVRCALVIPLPSGVTREERVDVLVKRQYREKTGPAFFTIHGSQ